MLFVIIITVSSVPMFSRALDGRCASTILCSRSRCGAREAMTVGCKPTSEREKGVHKMGTVSIRQCLTS